jgi:hypothetical protein
MAAPARNRDSGGGRQQSTINQRAAAIAAKRLSGYRGSNGDGSSGGSSDGGDGGATAAEVAPTAAKAAADAAAEGST